ncbi:MAG: AMP-binding protein [Muribaculaceae bacterium]|uniref:Long-chain fatty acid--CoA ligase n=1 Tax=Duncaniella dubosii TaxID=2518971 RepID=A0A4P7W250_9BACT|nr:AMP-binding protein [Duncaniella dubosii]MBJ2190388.1 AMP-binding protein [Muribaculaceae bacterium]QCD41999.1 long-chain fatty acid--CoA ligase [Duncaniella dubosii]
MNSKDNLLQIYASSFRQNWDLPALTEFGSGQTMTYADMSRRIAAIHMLFKECGVKRGDKIALMGRNSFSWVVVYMATLTYGAVVVPVLHDFNVQDAQHIINHSDSVILFINESIFDNMEFDKIPQVKAVMSLDRREVLAEHPVTNRAVEKFLARLPEKMRRKYPHGFTTADIDYPDIDESELAEINYTSGTTGFSKGVMLTLGNLGGNVRFGVRSRLHFRGSRALSFLPLAHAYGCAFDMLVPLAVGTHVTILGKLPTPKLLLKAFAEVRPSLVICVPLILEKIYRNKLRPVIEKPAVRNALKLPGLKTLVFRKIRNQLVEAFGGEFAEVIVGGAPLNREVEEFLHRIKFPFTVGYGMTECGPLISYTPWRQFIPSSSGRTLPSMECRIADSADPERIPGEICVRGENVMRGYFKNPEATEAVIDAEGWLHTGDMGTLSDDRTIFIRGRYKTMILGANGQNIYPEEIEAKLNNMPYVCESLVVERGKHLIALVYPDYEAMDRDKIQNEKLPGLMEQVRSDLNRLVAPYERIDRIQLIANEFEKTPKRSIKRYLYNA